MPIDPESEVTATFADTVETRDPGLSTDPVQETVTTDVTSDTTESSVAVTDAAAVIPVEVSEVDASATEAPASGSSSEGTTSEDKFCVRKGIRYELGDSVPGSSCETNCTCTDDSIHCQKKSCPPQPPSFLNCSRVDEPESCCPTFLCCKFRLILIIFLLIYLHVIRILNLLRL